MKKTGWLNGWINEKLFVVVVTVLVVVIHPDGSLFWINAAPIYGKWRRYRPDNKMQWPIIHSHQSVALMKGPRAACEIFTFCHYWKINGFSASKLITKFYTKERKQFYESLVLDALTSQLNLVHSVALYVYKNSFNIIITFYLYLPNFFFSYTSLRTRCMHLQFIPRVLHNPPNCYIAKVNPSLLYSQLIYFLCFLL